VHRIVWPIFVSARTWVITVLAWLVVIIVYPLAALVSRVRDRVRQPRD
jgi:hypothetical protein